MKSPNLKLLILLLTLSACSNLALKKPDVQVADIQLGNTSLLEQDITVMLRVQNPNDRTLSAKGLGFDLNVNGKKIASGLSAQPISLPAMGETTVPLLIHTSILDWLKLASDAIKQGKPAVHYTITGQIQQIDGWGTLPFTREGDWIIPVR